MSYSTRDLERLVRFTYEGIHDDPTWDQPVPHCLRVARIMRILDQQPELLERSRLSHNLGAAKWNWLQKMHEQYLATDPDVWR